jgi:hypothetical protein
MSPGERNTKSKMAEIALDDITQNQVKIQEVRPNEVIISDRLISQGGNLIAFIFFFTSLLVIAFRRYKITDEDDNITLSTNSNQNLPCINCKYFSKNHHLKCAVQPYFVMKPEAINCSDYCQKSAIITAKK